MGSHLYLSYFGLKEPPFTITPDPRYLYMSERHREALAHLLYAIGQGGGFVQLTGEVGTGKTTLSRCLLEQLPPDVDVALILNPHLTSFELLAAVCDELHVARDGATTSKMLVDALYGYLLDAHARRRRTVLIMDEAQQLPVEVLEEIRLLTNLETTRQKLLQIVLIGQPELIELLNRNELRQLAQRITARYHLEPFSRAETRDYIAHRLGVAGATRPLFGEAAIRRVHAVSRGIPRLINVICDRALLGAYSENAVRVGVRTVARAAREVRGRRAPRRSRPRWRWASIAAALGLVTIGAALGLSAAPLALRLKPSGLATSGVGLVAEHAPALSARGSAIESSASQPAAAIPAPASRLAPLLAEGRLRTDQAAAVATLYSRWGLEQPIVRGQWDCETARADGLRCLFKTGTWATLRRYNLPAVLELIAPGRPKHYAAVTALDDHTVTLSLGGRQLTLPIGEVDPLWAGDFILVWKPPVAIRVPLAPGMYGADVEWVRQRLAAVDGQTSPANKGKLYDAELKDRVVSFQRARSLDPDGLVGDETLAHLASAVPAANLPLLSSTRRVSMATARP